MMRPGLLTSVVVAAALVAAAARAAAAQPPSPSPPDAAVQPASPAATRLTLSGCVESGAPAGTRFTLFDPHHGVMYRLTSARQGLFAGRRIPVVGALVPTPNIAAQAGSIDPATAAFVAAAANPFGRTPFNRLKGHVPEIRPLQRCGP
jgi:hypothetical protein